MPFQGEFANKSSHFDIVKNPEVASFLKSCEYIVEPSEDEGRVIGAQFAVAPTLDDIKLPEKVIAIDGSLYEASINEHLPSTKVGYVKIGAMLIDMQKFDSLRVNNGHMVDPFKVSELQKDNESLSFSLPSSNIRLNGKDNVRDSFRAQVDAELYSIKTRFNPSDPFTSLRTTLFHLASRRSGSLGTQDPTRLLIHKCPSCEEGPVEVKDIPGQQTCSNCGEDVYPSDCLRLWEEVSDYQSNYSALTRFMLVVEHMLSIHYMRYLRDNSLSILRVMAFFVDGPLAIFGPAAWLHSSIMRYIYEVNEQLKKAGHQKIVLIGIQKTGQVVDHVNLIGRFIEKSRIFPIKDAYRYKYILPGRDPSSSGFGSETYYGQDFIYKTASGRKFVFALPYPFESKSMTENFPSVKTEIGNYPELARALAIIKHFEMDLYEDAVVPIALAHRYTAISLVPGGKVLDLLTRNAFKTKS